MKKVLNGKLVILGCLLLWVLFVRMLTGCSMQKEGADKVRDLDFTVIGENEVPEELKQIIAEKMAAPFKLTYSNDQNLYIVVGYGEQPTGGFSITVGALYLTENAIVINTELIGPGKDEAVKAGTSNPYVVVKTEYLENPVVFQ